ncbi:hypothetical protein ACOSP7_022224 [Xanthoceras sorbifolium]
MIIVYYTISSIYYYTIPRFDGHYDQWSTLMENFLRGIKDRARSIEAKGFEGKELPLPSN